MTSDWKRAKELFEAALERPTAERATFLDAACAGDGALRREVSELLAAADAADRDFLEHAAVVDEARTEVDDAALAPGDRVGPYRIVRELGRGGMGVVYLAQPVDASDASDASDPSRQVAIKLVQSERASIEVLRRFEAERQILGSLDHPSIARLRGGGSTDGGRPYLVVDYVDGEPLDVYCDRSRLGVEERLQLFRKVCAVVHYAHQNLVVHRDLKPNNIFVTAEGQIKLLDFGIAKLIQPTLRGASLTRLGSRPMSPDYASPEQVRGERITTATDVYALGLLLFELLTGRRAYRLTDESTEALVDAVCQRVPAAPSVVVRTATAEIDPETLARRRGRDAAGLARELAGDLDTIVAVALRKEPERRYASALQLSLDLRRYLTGMPVQAQLDTLRYRVGKFVGRHRGAVAVAAATMILVVALLVLMARRQQRLTHERDAARTLVAIETDVCGAPAERAERMRRLAAELRDLDLDELAITAAARAVSLEAQPPPGPDCASSQTRVPVR